MGTVPPKCVGGPLCTRCVVFCFFPRWPRCSPALGVGVGDKASGGLGCLLIRWDSVSDCVSGSKEQVTLEALCAGSSLAERPLHPGRRALGLC